MKKNAIIFFFYLHRKFLNNFFLRIISEFHNFLKFQDCKKQKLSMPYDFKGWTNVRTGLQPLSLFKSVFLSIFFNYKKH